MRQPLSDERIGSEIAHAIRLLIAFAGLTFKTIFAGEHSSLQGSDLTKAEVYSEVMQFEGICGTRSTDLKYEYFDWLLTGPTGFSVDTNGNIFIADNLNGKIKCFSRKGDMLMEKAVTSTVSIDALCWIEKKRIVYRDWNNREYITIIDLEDSARIKCILPQTSGAKARSRLFFHDSAIYLSYHDRNFNEIALRYNLKGVLVETRSCDTALWIETGGRYLLTERDGGQCGRAFFISEVYNRDGTPFFRGDDKEVEAMQCIGIDGFGNFYGVIESEGDSLFSPGNYVVKISSDGVLQAKFQVRNYIIDLDGRTICVNLRGDVYVLSVDRDSLRWGVYRYSRFKP